MNDKLTSLRDFIKEAQDDVTEMLEGNMSSFPDKIDNDVIVLRPLLMTNRNFDNSNTRLCFHINVDSVRKTGMWVISEEE